MLQNYNTYRVMELFFDSPTKKFQLRDLSRRLKLGLPSVRNIVKRLKKEGLIEKVKGNVYDSYAASQNDKFKLYKKQNTIIRIFDIGLIDFLSKEFMPNSIILFGSCSRGEDAETSDLDIFIEAEYQKVSLKNFEKILKRKINIFFEPKPTKLSKELRNNLANGIVLYGYFKVV